MDITARMEGHKDLVHKEAIRMVKRMAAFTLIELLVVITIIAILAGILFPVFSRAREKGRSAACQSNLKQIGLAMAMYREDFDLVNVPGPDQGAVLSWAVLLKPYHKNTQIFTCPSRARWEIGPTVNCPGDAGCVQSGGYQMAVLRDTQSGQSGTGWHDSDIEDPSNTVIAIDSKEDANALNKTIIDQGAYDPTDRNLNRHFDGINVLWYDGHVKYMRSDKLKTEDRYWTINED